MKCKININGKEYKGDIEEIEEKEFPQELIDTKKEAEMHKLRLEGLAVKQTGNIEECFYIWDFNKEKPRYIFESRRLFYAHAIDKKFEKEEECQDWGDKYAEAFEFFNR